MIFWKSWNWPSYSTECLLYWLHWHLVVEMSPLTVKMPKFASRYYRLWMWRHSGTQHWRCPSTWTDYGNSHPSGSKIQYTLITGDFSELKMSGPLWTMSWKFWGHFDIGPYRCQWGIQLHCITVSHWTMTRLFTGTAWCELWPRRRLNWRKTCALLWS